jgi:hypothetical protein
MALRYRNYTVEFELDGAKGAANAKKHRTDFDAAQVLWEDPDLLLIPARTTDEPRWLVIGTIEGRHWSAVITYRDERTRIISVRRSRSEEIGWYEDQG